MELSDKVAVVTGGLRGIGKGISLALAKEGSNIAIIDRKDDSVANQTVQDIKDMGRFCKAYYETVTDYDQMVRTFSAIIDEFGKIDVLVNNAGRASSIDFVRDVRIKEWHNVLNVNLNGVFYCSKAVLDHMRSRKTGCIINISSVIGSGYGSHAGASSYSASKAAVNALTRVLAREEARNGIRVNAVAPGYIQTEILEKIIETQGERFLETIPLMRYGLPEEIGYLVVFLVSDKAKYITGQIIHINGGMYYIKSL